MADQIEIEDWQKLRNDVELIKNGVLSLDRLAVLQNRAALESDLKRLVNNQPLRAAVLHLAKEEMKASQLAAALGVDPGNLSLYTKPFTGMVGYLAVIRIGKTRVFIRDPKLTMINYDVTEPFKSLIDKWRQGLQSA